MFKSNINVNYYQLIRCPNCRGKLLKEKDSLICASCRTKFYRSEGFWNLMPTTGQYEPSEKDKMVYSQMKENLEKVSYTGPRGIISRYSLHKIQDENYQILLRYTNLDHKRILEMGCGRGYFANKVASNHNVSYVAADYELNNLKYAKELGNTDFLDLCFLGNIYKIPFADESFDIVVIAEVLEHLEEPDSAMKELTRVLQKGGILLASVPNSIMWFYPWSLLATLWDAVKHPFNQNSGFYRFVLHLKRLCNDNDVGMYHRPFLPMQFRRLFNKAHYEIRHHKTSIFYFWHPPFSTFIEKYGRKPSKFSERLTCYFLKVTDFLIDSELPLLRWIGTRQHILGRKN